MATFDEAYLAATKRLDERGQLLNVELLRLVDQDEELLREIRETLIFHGIATDRFGVGLARSSQPMVPKTAAPVAQGGRPTAAGLAPEIHFQEFDQTPVEEWRVMTGGMTRGPFSLPVLRSMWQRGEIGLFDLLRRGDRGIWQRPEELEFLADITPRPDLYLVPASSGVIPHAAMEVAHGARPTDVVPVEIAAGIPPESSPQTKGDLAFYLSDQGESIGPFSREEIRLRLSSGRISSDDMVQVGPQGDWQPLSSALGLARPPLAIPRNTNPSPLGASVPTLGTAPARLGPNAGPSIKEPSGPDPAGAVLEKGAAPDRSRSKASHPSAKRSQGTAASSASAEAEPSTIRKVWHQGAKLVGGSLRLATLLGGTAAIVMLVWFLRQPPSSDTICREVQSAYAKLSAFRDRQRPGEGVRSSPKGFETELSRTRYLRDVLKKRASASRRGDLELLWACDFGLLPLLEHPYAEESEKLFLDHIANAVRELGLLPPVVEKNGTEQNGTEQRGMPPSK